MPAVFYRDPRPSWNPADPYSPHPDYTRRELGVRMAVLALPPFLEEHLLKRFLRPRPANWTEPPALPSLTRRGYAPGEVSDFSAKRLCNEITIEAELFERTLHAPAGAVGGLSYNHLLAVHVVRLRQLWEEFSWRRWPEGWRYRFFRALG